MDHSGGCEHVGKHRVRFIPPDVFHFEIHGDVSTDDVNGIFDKAEALAATLPPGIFWITDARDQGHLSEAARKATAMRSAAIGVRAFAMLGASFTVRVIALMMAKATRLLNRKIDHGPVEFLGNEKEALAWFETLRRIAPAQDDHRGS